MNGKPSSAPELEWINPALALARVARVAGDAEGRGGDSAGDVPFDGAVSAIEAQAFVGWCTADVCEFVRCELC